MSNEYYHFRRPRFSHQQYEDLNGEPPPRSWWETKLAAWVTNCNGGVADGMPGTSGEGKIRVFAMPHRDDAV